MATPMKIMAALAGAAIVVAGGSAYTAASDPIDSVAGYGSADVTGATAESVEHTLNATGDKIMSTTVVFTAPQTGNLVKAAFNTDDLTLGTIGEGAAADTVTFSWGAGKSTASQTEFHVAVTNDVP